ncbi:MAG: peptide-methionine (S)-S-oxide reductase MsrA [Fimbriimonadaceae bacterium]|nr:peptide-methionine (S)-S-oxide reductase MsrA [Fimbriimonadaceae bacterium]
MKNAILTVSGGGALACIAAVLFVSGANAVPQKEAGPAGVGQVAVKKDVGTNPGAIRDGWPLKVGKNREVAMLSAGCFWGVEEWFRMQPGVVATAVGYAGGRVNNPTYQQVCYNNTGHAESVLVEFDTTKTSYAEILKAFWEWHNPTLVNRQGPDVGDQYRTAIWTFNQTQVDTALKSRQREQRNWNRPIATTVKPAPRFWMAEEYHQQYDEKTGKKSCNPRTGIFIKN